MTLGRGRPLRRATGLARPSRSLAPGPPLVRYSPLRPSAPLSPGGPRPTPFRPRRPTPPGTAERRARTLVAARAGDGLLCELCRRRPGAEWSHRKPRSAGQGGWCPSNGLWACHGCHVRCHDHPALACRQGWFVRRAHAPAEVPAWLAAHGWVLLDTAGGLTPTDRRPPEDAT